MYNELKIKRKTLNVLLENVGDLMSKIKNDIQNTIQDRGILNYHVLDGMADWVRVVDSTGSILFANKVMKEHFDDDMVGKQCYFIHEDKKRCSFCISNISIITGEVVQKEEIIAGKYYSVKSSPITNSEGEIFAAVEVFRDVTRERKLEIELIERNKKMRTDLEFAKRIQERILPKKGELDCINLDYIYRPSEMLSGDMFDVFHIDRTHIGIYISDVAGHGVSASMMTMFIRQTMRVLKGDILSPSQALTELHGRFALLNLDVDKYFTIFYGVLNTKTGEFIYANGGHNCIPIKFGNNNIELLEISGFPIALLGEEMYYEEKRVKLIKGDSILFYTDGITEIKDKKGIEFGVEGVLNTIKESPANILKEIEENVIEHNYGEQEDDFALVLMEYTK